MMATKEKAKVIVIDPMLFQLTDMANLSHGHAIDVAHVDATNARLSNGSACYR